MIGWWVWLAGCGLGGGEAVEVPQAPDLPEGSAVITEHTQGFAVDGVPVVPFEVLEHDPVSASDERLKEALAGRPDAWLQLPPDLAWYRARKAFGSARAVGIERPWVSAGAEPPVREGSLVPIGLRMSCREGPVAWTGVLPRVTVAVQRSAVDGTWAVASARFLPVVEGVPTDGLSWECLQPRTCEQLYPSDAQLASDCVAGTKGAPSRVSLGGEVGCLVPLSKTPGQLDLWEAALPPVVKQLGLDRGYPVLVVPEARVRLDAVTTVLRSFEAAGAPVPTLGEPLVEGNDGAPLCQAEVRDARGLQRAAAAYAGWLVGAATPSPRPNEETDP